MYHGTGAPAKTSGYMDRLPEEIVEIKILPNNVNTEEGFKPISNQ
jgi:hypothetical protein